MLATAALLAVPVLATAHSQLPAFVAGHAFIGDPLYALDSPEGSLYTSFADQETAEASTTKTMTLHLAVLAIEAGVVSESDTVTINSFEAGVGGSSMQDVNGVALQSGEKVSLGLLLRGMMYPSGNNAAYAIARHVAQGYLGSGADWPDFVDMMNDHATLIGLTHTHFANPNGFDDANHYTTARELAMIWAHSIPDSKFQSIVGFSGTYTGTSKTANGATKTYSWGWGYGYAGWEGAKGGGTTNCNGNAGGCMVMSAERLGRRVVLAYMQGNPWTQESGMFDYGFEKIFHPDSHGSDASQGAVSAWALACSDWGGAETVTVSSNLVEKFGLWSVDPGSNTVSLSKSGSVALGASGAIKYGLGQVGLVDVPDNVGPAIRAGDALVGAQAGPVLSPVDDAVAQAGVVSAGAGPQIQLAPVVSVARLSYGTAVTAVARNGNVELTRWSIPEAGAITVAETGVQAGAGNHVALERISNAILLSGVIEPSGNLALKTWHVNNQGKLVVMHSASAGNVREFSMVTPTFTDITLGTTFVTAARTTSNLLQVKLWQVDASGLVTLVKTYTASGDATKVSVSWVPVVQWQDEIFSAAYYAVGYRTSSNTGKIAYFRAFSGSFDRVGDTGSSNPDVDATSVAGLGSNGVLFATREAGSHALNLTVFDHVRNADESLSPRIISWHEGSAIGSRVSACRLNSYGPSEGDFAVAYLGGSNKLTVTGWRVGDRP